MLVLNSLRALHLRSFTTTASIGRARAVLTRNDVDFVLNPEKKHLDAFMECHGNDRAVFKKDDILLWQKSFGEDYKFRVMCTKGTNEVIASSHSCLFRPIDSSNKPTTFIGLGWVAPKIRKLRGAALASDMLKEGAMTAEDQITSNVNGALLRFWHLLCNKKNSDKTGSEALNIGYKSFYEYKDVFIPEGISISFDGITIKNAKDVPKKDMIAYDQTIHPYHREEYFVSHMNDKEGFGKVAYDEKGKVVGMAQAVIYPKGDCNLGPVYGDNPRVVQAMFAEILKDIKASGKLVKSFEVRSIDSSEESYTWIKPFLKCEQSKEEACRLFYHHWKPVNVDYSKVYAPTHAQLFLV